MLCGGKHDDYKAPESLTIPIMLLTDLVSDVAVYLTGVQAIKMLDQLLTDYWH
jgi:hypothetical protein